MDRLITALKNGDEKNFSQIVENEALTLHALMLSSNPSICLMKSNTLTVITKLREFRDNRNLNFAFTLDAGPNIHILYPQTARKQVVDYINSELKAYFENEAWIDDELSEGPKPLNIVTSVRYME
jgi:diphosphomevalonate decarboxylase